jgi:hypothetical protein
MTSVEVKAETRTIKTAWTIEKAEDIQSLTDLDMTSFERYFAKELRRKSRKKSINKILKN